MPSRSSHEHHTGLDALHTQPTIQDDLEQLRLGHRAEHVQLALRMLRARASAYSVRGEPVPGALRRTLDVQQDALRDIRARLAAVGPSHAARSPDPATRVSSRRPDRAR
jgi:hypothetical protein